MSNYDYRPELEEQKLNEQIAIENLLKLGDEEAINKELEKLKEEANDSVRNDRETPPC